MSNARSCGDARKILRMMRTDGISIGRWIWNAYAQTLTSIGKIHSVINAMERKGFTPSAPTLKHLNSFK